MGLGESVELAVLRRGVGGCEMMDSTGSRQAGSAALFDFRGFCRGAGAILHEGASLARRVENLARCRKRE